jgi:phosphatidylinositol glycan class U
MIHSELFKYTPHIFYSISALIFAIALGPLMFNAWVYAGSGNANFFYAITLVWSVAQIILIIDLMYAFLKREFERKNPAWRRMRVELLYQVDE